MYDEEVAKIEADWQQHLAEMEEMRRQPPLSHEEALAFVTEVLKSWSPTYLPEDEALELAMSEEIAEWNWDLD